MIGKKTWKKAKLDYIKTEFGDCIDSWKDKTDDRRWYVNYYNMIIEALNSLPDEPHVYVRHAMNNVINEDCKLLTNIKKNF